MILRWNTIILVTLLALMTAPFIVSAQLTPAARAALEAQLVQLEAEIKAQEVQLSGQKNQSTSITSEINRLRSDINATKTKINYRNTQIKKLKNEIGGKENTIKKFQTTIAEKKVSLGKLLRRTYQLEEQDFLYVIMGSESVSDFYFDTDSYISIKRSLGDSIDELGVAKISTEEQKVLLEKKREEEADVKAELERAKNKVESVKKEQDGLLAVSKSKEKTYEQVIADRRARASSIRAALFELRGQNGIPFGTALDFAQSAGKKTGVRAALILAILKQESNLGKNVGTCNRPGDARTWKTIMPGPGQSWRDDQAAFVRITTKLGISPDGQALSCPLSSGGWGGAMGPSQFIPSTWEGYEKRVANAVGVSIADPWNPRHAIMATALYMSDLGAGAQTYTAEREAACKYYSGRGCSAPNVKNAFYGNAVATRANAMQEKIDFLEGVQ
ncbi:MAG: peptidoglycan hydrolase CwlO-like protein [Flavobacteriaceae bacterium]|jgi:peptidoglycan hydrolase CwlO-like protein